MTMYAGKFRQKCLQPCSRLRRQLCRSLYLNLDLNLNLGLYPALDRVLLRNSFQKSSLTPNPLSFRSLQQFAYRSLSLQVDFAPCLKPWPPIRPLYAVYRTCAWLQPADNTGVMLHARLALFPQFFSACSIRQSTIENLESDVCAP